MAAKSSSSLRLDDFVNAVHADPANVEPTVLLAGYLGKSPEEGNVRVYLDPSLCNWLEVPEAEVIHSRPIADSPLGGSQLWVRASAQLKPGVAGAAAPAAGDEEGGEEKAAVGADTGVFNPMATIHPTNWTQVCATGVGCIATIPCLPPSIGCPQGGALQGGPTGWYTCACPVGPTGWHTCACPATQLGCPNTVSCPPQGQGGLGAVGPTGTQGCTHVSPCVGQTGWHTCACPIGPTGYQGCVGAEAAAYPGNPTAATRCFICPPLTLDPTAATRCFICPPIEAAGNFAAAAQPAPLGPTGTQGCTQPGHCVGQTGWQTCACPPGFTGWHTCGCVGAEAGGVQQSTAATLCTRVAPCVGHTGWHTCACPIGPTGTQGCGANQVAGFSFLLCPGGTDIKCDTAFAGPAAAFPTGSPTAATRCFICPPLEAAAFAGGAQAGLPGPTGTQGCTVPPHCFGPTGTQGCGQLGGAQQGTIATVCTQIGCQPVITLVTVSGCQHPSWVDACPTRLCGIMTVSGPCLPYTLGGCTPGGRQL